MTKAHEASRGPATASRGVPPDWRRLAAVDTLVVLMGVRHRQAIARDLMDAGRSPDEPVAFVERGTTAEQRLVPSSLGEVAEGVVAMTAPAVWVVGSVVELQPQLAEEGLGAGERRR